MIIDKGKELVVFRYKPYKNYDFISAHQECISKYGSVWILKIGKQISATTLEYMCDDKRGLVLRAPKSHGGKMYFCHCSAYKYGEPTEEMKYPAYYSEIRDSEGYLKGSWIQITSMHELSEDAEKSLRLDSNDRRLFDVLQETRTVIMKVYAENEILTIE